METDVIIVGAGVCGVSLAFHLANQGTRVVLLERDAAPGAHPSGKDAGVVRHLYRHPQITQWTRHSVALWPDQIRNNYFKRTGSLIIGCVPPGHNDELFRKTTFAKSAGEAATADIPAVHTATDGLLDPRAM
jgi:glycine/D-amino acid oxidase-like deaminating enzyme